MSGYILGAVRMKAAGSPNWFDRYFRYCWCGGEWTSAAGNRLDLIGQQGQGVCSGLYGS